jgi:hypothetical protein
VGDGGVILKTTNSGSNWSALTSGTTAKLTGVAFTNNNNGTVVGEGGLILTTANAGTDWTERSSGTSADFAGIAWTTNDNSAVAIGSMSAISYTDDNATFDYGPYGSKSFDIHLTYKHFTPNVPHTLLMDAIDTLSGTLRGYQASKTILLAPGKDTTVTPNSSLAACGYGGAIPDCL